MLMEAVYEKVDKFLVFLPRSVDGLEADWVHMPERGDTVDPCCEEKAVILVETDVRVLIEERRGGGRVCQCQESDKLT